MAQTDKVLRVIPIKEWLKTKPVFGVYRFISDDNLFKMYYDPLNNTISSKYSVWDVDGFLKGNSINHVLTSESV